MRWFSMAARCTSTSSCLSRNAPRTIPTMAVAMRKGRCQGDSLCVHAVVRDGVYAIGEGRGIRFHPLPPPDDPEVARVTTRIARRILALLERRGLGPQADP